MDRRSRHQYPTAGPTRLADVLPFRASRRAQFEVADDEAPDPDFVEGLRLLWADLSTMDTPRRRPPRALLHPVGEPAAVISLAERRARRDVRVGSAEDPLDPCG